MIFLLISLSLLRASDPHGKDVSGHRKNILSGSSIEVTVQVLDNGTPVGSRWVKFSAEGGKLSRDSALTDNSGFARVNFIPEGPGWVQASINDESITIEPRVFSKNALIEFILAVIIGTILILVGLDNTNKGFSRFSGEQTRRILWKLTDKPLLAYAGGVLLAIFLESSTLTGLMLLSLLESSLVKLSTALIVLSGAALGSTFTVQIIATDIIKFSPIIVLAGYLIWQLKSRWSYIGRILFGFGLIFFSIWLIRDNIRPLTEIFSLNINPLLLFVISIGLTFLFHSSAATLGLLIAFAGVIDFSAVLPVILGANIGTTFSILLGSTRTQSAAGKAMGAGYIILKVLFVGLSFYLFFIPENLIPSARDIANIHTLVNFWGFLLIPLCFPLARFLKKKFGEKPSGITLNPVYLSSTSVAISKSHEVVRNSMKTAVEMFRKTLVVFRENNNQLRKIVENMDNDIDENQEDLTAFSSQLLGQELSEKEGNKCVNLLKIMNEIEHIGDIISNNLMPIASKKIKDGYYFSSKGFKEIQQYHNTIKSNMEEVEAAVSSMDRDMARDLLDERENSEKKLCEYRESHLQRLKEGKKSSIDTSSLHLDLLNEFDRINIHLYNIARALVGKL